MAKYSIEDTSLIAIGDAVRNKTGKLTRIEQQTILVDRPAVSVVKTDNAVDADTWKDIGLISEETPEEGICQVLKFPGASQIKTDGVYAVSLTGKQLSCHNLNIRVGEWTVNDFPLLSSGIMYNDTSAYFHSVTYNNADTVTVWWKNTDKNAGQFFFYIEFYPLDADGNNMPGGKVEKEIDVEVTNTLTPAQMAEEINNLGDIIPEEVYTITGNCDYRFSNGCWDWFIEKCGDKLTTKDITSMSNMFFYSKLESIPFDLNLSKNASNNDLSYIFNNAQNLIEVPYLKGELNVPTGAYSYNPGITRFFADCRYLRNIPDDYFDQFGGDEFWTGVRQYTKSRGNTFSTCYSLRKLPSSWVKLRNKVTSAYSHIYYYSFNVCASLDEITNIPIESDVTLTSNCFQYTFDNCHRVKEILFETNQDGSPIAVNWKSQTIDLTKNLGYVTSSYINEGYVTEMNSGITKDKKVYDDKTYQALKNDPDWYSTYLDYCRYNRSSAVATINSLPDTTQSGGTNTIKFKGAAGALTDGGAINTLTEEEIAVATAKGWTVTFV